MNDLLFFLQILFAFVGLTYGVKFWRCENCNQSTRDLYFTKAVCFLGFSLSLYLLAKALSI